jgi:trigger factor
MADSNGKKSTMADNRPPIPRPVQREVRQRCGFGCVICGMPLYEYDHIEDYAVVLEHRAENLTLLCDKHHKEKTNNLLTKEQVKRANSNPINVQRGISAPYGLHFEGNRFAVELGGNNFSAQLRESVNDIPIIAISIDDNDLLSFRIDASGNLFMNTLIFDRANFPLLVIEENRIIYSMAAWDVEFAGKTLTVREAVSEILFEVEFVPPSGLVINRAHLLCNGIELLVRPSHVYVLNSDTILKKCQLDYCQIGLQLGRNQRGLGAAFGTSSAVLSRYLLSKSEITKRENRALKSMENQL